MVWSGTFIKLALFMEILNHGILHVLGVDCFSWIFQQVESIFAKNCWYDIGPVYGYTFHLTSDIGIGQIG